MSGIAVLLVGCVLSKYKKIQSVVRALDILELVGSCEAGLPLHGIAHGLGLKKQTAHGLVRTLVIKRYLQRTSSPIRYKLGAVMKGLRVRHAKWNRLLAIATPVVMRLSRQANGSASLGQYLAGEAITRFQASPAEQMPTKYSRGWHMNPYGTGLLLQAYMDEEEIREFRHRQPLEESEAQCYWGTSALLDRCLGIVRQEGLLTMVRDGLFRAAAPILAPAGDLVGVLTLVRPFSQMPPTEADRCISLLRKAAGQIAEAAART